ncbi:hypothetical protein BJ508DRAFT_308194 [Ascobolus immersus RN42]|uniref:Uncharacterized protein n=1 Tax=Ascobolus immersus RN42 TaxID=1160509 RepID=A0A3N4I5X9_ASCIM|nr:hypothetical protein BJ508DRAFT_308194 [Ascobolus immersus RN42]
MADTHEEDQDYSSDESAAERPLSSDEDDTSEYNGDKPEGESDDEEMGDEDVEEVQASGLAPTQPTVAAQLPIATSQPHQNIAHPYHQQFASTPPYPTTPLNAAATAMDFSGEGPMAQMAQMMAFANMPNFQGTGQTNPFASMMATMMQQMMNQQQLQPQQHHQQPPPATVSTRPPSMPGTPTSTLPVPTQTTPTPRRQHNPQSRPQQQQQQQQQGLARQSQLAPSPQQSVQQQHHPVHQQHYNLQNALAHQPPPNHQGHYNNGGHNQASPQGHQFQQGLHGNNPYGNHHLPTQTGDMQIHQFNQIQSHTHSTPVAESSTPYKPAQDAYASTVRGAAGFPIPDSITVETRLQMLNLENIRLARLNQTGGPVRKNEHLARLSPEEMLSFDSRTRDYWEQGFDIRNIPIPPKGKKAAEMVEIGRQIRKRRDEFEMVCRGHWTPVIDFSKFSSFYRMPPDIQQRVRYSGCTFYGDRFGWDEEQAMWHVKDQIATRFQGRNQYLKRISNNSNQASIEEASSVATAAGAKMVQAAVNQPVSTQKSPKSPKPTKTSKRQRKTVPTKTSRPSADTPETPNNASSVAVADPLPVTEEEQQNKNITARLVKDSITVAKVAAESRRETTEGSLATPKPNNNTAPRPTHLPMSLNSMDPIDFKMSNSFEAFLLRLQKVDPDIGEESLIFVTHGSAESLPIKDDSDMHLCYPLSDLEVLFVYAYPPPTPEQQEDPGYDGYEEFMRLKNNKNAKPSTPLATAPITPAPVVKPKQRGGRKKTAPKVSASEPQEQQTGQDTTPEASPDVPSQEVPLVETHTQVLESAPQQQVDPPPQPTKKRSRARAATTAISDDGPAKRVRENKRVASLNKPINPDDELRKQRQEDRNAVQSRRATKKDKTDKRKELDEKMQE